ncbi:ABC transporter ATP-binding protein [Cytophaga aurantiaca]|uniref:ABC transporter ATP-binding protein n=1 Tax=Cytophaga aurantiaca TaxID=29530 RepID=UPI00037DC1C4|nr:ATP-binding cassette domain-containing protein [Cytophaga aurantiaca]
MNILEIKDLSVDIQGRSIVNAFNLTAKPGDVVFITGDNGSGKSTVLKTIAGYIPSSKGSIHFSGKQSAEYSLLQWHQVVHYLPQHNSLAFPIKVKDLLIMAFYRDKKWFEEYSSLYHQAVTELAQRFGITHLLDRNAKELSGGELQLCWLVQSFLARPEVLLLDEPTQYLDAKNRTLFFSLLNEMQALNPFICLCVTHDLPFKKEAYGTILTLS